MMLSERETAEGRLLAKLLSVGHPNSHACERATLVLSDRTRDLNGPTGVKLLRTPQSAPLLLWDGLCQILPTRSLLPTMPPLLQILRFEKHP